MKSKRLIELAISLSLLSQFLLSAQASSGRLIQISSNNNFTLTPISTIICTQEGLAAKESFDVGFQGRKIKLEIYYRPKKGVSVQQVLDFFGQKKVTPGRVYFGMGSSYEKFSSADADIVPVAIQNLKLQKFTALWGSGRSHDILVYRYRVSNHSLVEEVLITFLNVYLGPQTSDIPLSNAHVSRQLKARDSRYAAYAEIENWLHSWQYY